MRLAPLSQRVSLFCVLSAASVAAGCGGGGADGAGVGAVPPVAPVAPAVAEPLTLALGAAADGTHSTPSSNPFLPTTRAGLTGNDEKSLAVGDAPFGLAVGGNERRVGSMLRFSLADAPAGRRLLSATLVLHQRPVPSIDFSLTGLGERLTVEHVELVAEQPGRNDMLDGRVLSTSPTSIGFRIFGGGAQSADLKAFVEADLLAGRTTCDIRVTALRVVGDGEDTLVKYASSEATDENDRPALILVFE